MDVRLISERNEQIEYVVQEKAGKEKVYDLRERGKHIVEHSSVNRQLVINTEYRMQRKQCGEKEETHRRDFQGKQTRQGI